MPLTLLIVVVAVSLTVGRTNDHNTPSHSVLPMLTTTAPTPGARGEQACADLLSVLPVKLGELNPRAVTAQWVVAWGEPAVVLRCGVGRPAGLVPASSDFVIDVNGVNWLPVKQKDQTVFYAIDRPVYVEVSVPEKQAYQPLPLIAQAITKKLPAVCQVPEQGQPQPPDAKLCTHRP